MIRYNSILEFLSFFSIIRYELYNYKAILKVKYYILKGITEDSDMLSESAGQHVRSSRNDCPGMPERLSGAARQNYKSIFIMLK